MGRELADDNGAGVGQTAHRGRVLLRHVVDHDLRVSGRRHTLGLVDILQANRNAVQRSAPMPGHDLGLGRAGRVERRLAEHADKAVELAVEPLDAGEAALTETTLTTLGPCETVTTL